MDNVGNFLNDLVKLAKKHNVILFNDYNHLSVKEKEGTKFCRIDDCIELLDSEEDSMELFGF